MSVMRTWGLPVVPVAMDTEPMELGMAAQIICTQGLNIVHPLAMAQAALATTTSKREDLLLTAS